MNILGNFQMPEWLKKSGDIILTITAFVATSGVGLGVIWSQGVGFKPTATLWALACLACGAIIGFLFGIPRVLQQEAQPAAPPANNQTEGSREAAAASTYRLQVNTNLEQISDWLTKIIVGVGLIELRNFPGYLNRASSFIGGGLGGGGNAKVLAGSMILYFVVVGFLAGYLLTRLYLTGAFKRADEKAIVSVGGNELTIEEVSVLVRASIADLQTKVGEMQRGMGEMQQAFQDTNPSFDVMGASAPQTESVKVRSILWVDDFPKNNSLIVEHLNKLGIDVVTALSTSEAMEALKSKPFDRVITDMGRIEGNVEVKAAGINLIRAIRKEFPDLLVVVYCSPPAVAQYGAEALTAGAVKVTPSQTELLEALNLYGSMVSHIE